MEKEDRYGDSKGNKDRQKRKIDTEIEKVKEYRYKDIKGKKIQRQKRKQKINRKEKKIDRYRDRKWKM